MDLSEMANSLKSEISTLETDIKALLEVDSSDAEAVKNATKDAESKSNDLVGKRAKLEEVENKINWENAQADIEKLLVKNSIPSNKPQKIVVPASARLGFNVAGFDNNEDAYVAGRKMLANCFNHAPSKKWLQNHSIQNVERMTEGNDDKGGLFVPNEVEMAIVRNVESFGIARQECKRTMMNAEIKDFPVRTAGMTGDWVGESTDGSANGASSTPTYKNAKLVAKKLKAWCKVSDDLNEDSVLEIVNLIIQEASQIFSDNEDDALFNGDGSDTYGGIKGLKNRLAAGSVYDAATGELAFSDLDLEDFEAVIGQLPHFNGHQPKWYISKLGYWHSMARLMDAGGGNSIADLGAGPQRQFLGYPVVWCQKMYASTADSASNMAAYFGDMSQTAVLGDRRGVTLNVDPSRYWDEDNLGVKVTERLDINVHSAGDATNAGPMIALKFAAS